MDFELNEDQRAFADTAQQFADERLVPMAAEWDEKQIFPKDVLREAGELGFLLLEPKRPINKFFNIEH